jgi:DNA-binding NtrC family response regulator
MIERALPFCDGPEVRISALPDALRGAKKDPRATPAEVIAPNHDASISFKDAKDGIIDAFERQYLVDLLERHGGNVSRAARSADMDRKSITRLMKKHGIARG